MGLLSFCSKGECLTRILGWQRIKRQNWSSETGSGQLDSRADTVNSSISWGNLVTDTLDTMPPLILTISPQGNDYIHIHLRDEAHKQALENMCSMNNMKNSSTWLFLFVSGNLLRRLHLWVHDNIKITAKEMDVSV